MKLNKFSKKKVGEVLGQSAGFIGGMALSNGISEIIPMANKTASKAIVAAIGLATAVMVNNKVVKTIGVGMIAQQGKELINEAAAPYLPSGDSAVTKFINDSFEQPVIAILPAAAGESLGNPDPFNFRLAHPINTPHEQTFVMA